jgi:drug/metabolite transporter (DMT)-like permease
MKRYYGEGALLINAVVWGATFAIIKSALDFITPSTFIFLRFSLSTLILLPFIYKILINTNKETYIGGAVVGMFYFLGFAAQTVGLNYTSATKSGFITGTFVVMIPIFQLLIEKRAPRISNIIGIIFVFAGLVFLSSKGSSLLNIFSEIGNDLNIGDFLTFLCAIFFALNIVYVDIMSKRYNYIPLVFMQIGMTGAGGFLLMMFLSLFRIQNIHADFNSNLLFALFYTSIFATIITTILQTKFQKTVTPTKAGIIFSMEPIFAAIFAFFLLSEKISNFGLLGCLFIFGGLLISEVFDKYYE